MNTQQQARALMMRHHQAVKNRQMSMLNRAAAEIGVEISDDYSGTIQGKLSNNANHLYGRSNSALS